ncbi:hypothetical protein HA72_0713 [Metallosphaera sedula]|uniref:CobQ/CobB/MinD/ParA nucleotide binding domain-containing protein n=3 Tax=Metallosphaera TaxID=41980 RepID=A4YEN6_METS5|nr:MULTISPECIES: hypothetical protein [Metallosphaera]ABP94888.1 hypothetical protein Msed_0713 [Metallosphaera sedula DSM 5348]AIM26875.1 hypothetical protein HA72_0713 [Metallosphaera sedula]AKV73814.1 hypothetical protein MsedA_0726 [Metallosphaera sedula]AKV76054.1 hypothetical protein MsedB_0726 [Metallosphaera sedula]AKV78305.1 hypothetical protein MsedC_0725 [Metallosphaera sedula]
MKVYVTGRKGGTGKTIVALYLMYKLKLMGFRVEFKDLSENGIGGTFLKKIGFRRDPKPHYVIYDIKSSAIDGSQDMTILVIEFPFIRLETWNWPNKKILVINKANPFPDKFIQQLEQIKSLVPEFDHVVVVPFNGFLFNGELSSEPVLDKLSLIVSGKANDKLVLPFVEEAGRTIH